MGVKSAFDNSKGLSADDLLVERDGFGVEAVLHEAIGDLEVVAHGLLGLALLQVDVADLQADVRVGAVRLEERGVVLESLAQRPLLEVLLGRLEDLPLVDRQGHAPR